MTPWWEFLSRRAGDLGDPRRGRCRRSAPRCSLRPAATSSHSKIPASTPAKAPSASTACAPPPSTWTPTAWADSLRTALNARARRVIITPRPNPTGVSITADRDSGQRGVPADTPTSSHPGRPLLRCFPHALPPRYPADDLALGTRALGGQVPRPRRPRCRHRLRALNRRPGRHPAAPRRDLCQPPPAATRRRVADCNRCTQQFRGPATPAAVGSTCCAPSSAAAGVETPYPTDGLNVWIPVPADPAPIVSALREAGWSVRDGSSFRARTTGRPTGIRVTAARITPEQARTFAAACGGSI